MKDRGKGRVEGGEKAMEASKEEGKENGQVKGRQASREDGIMIGEEKVR